MKGGGTQLLKRDVDNLSGGERQRVAIARATALIVPDFGNVKFLLSTKSMSDRF